MAGFANDVVYANNGDFSIAGSAKGSATNGLNTNGQLWIGTTAANVGGTHINVGTLTSPGGTISIGYSSPNITLDTSATKVSFFAYLSTTQNNVTGDGTIYTIPFDTTLFNIGSGFNTGTGVFTAPVTGNYQFNSTVVYLNATLVSIYINAFQGTNFNVRLNQIELSNSSGNYTNSQSAIFPMTAGDTMFVTAAGFPSSKTAGIGGGLLTSYATTSMFSGFLLP